MQLVYFLLLPSALLSTQLLSFAADNSSVASHERQIIDWNALLHMWLVVGSFALAARWLEKMQHTYLEGSVVQNADNKTRKPIWMLHHRESLLLWLWCIVQPVCFVASGWTQWLQHFTQGNSWQFLNITLSLIPSMVLLFLVELIRESRMSQVGKPQSSLLKHFLHARKDLTRRIASTWLLPLALPIVTAGLMEMVNAVRVAGPNPGLLSTIACTLSISVLVTTLMPHLFTRLIGAEPIDDSVALIVNDVWRLGSNRVPRVLLWPTGCRMANAAVIGLFGFGRKLLLTDALLQKLDDRELSMVVLHEVAHCVRHHSWIRMMPTLIVVLLLFGSMSYLSGFWLSLSCGCLFLLFIASLIGVCWWTEFDADRFAIDTAARARWNAQGDQLRRDHAAELCSALRKIYGERNLKRRSWMHPSCEQRLAAIRMRI